MLRTYDMAIWPANHDYYLACVGYIEAEIPFTAALSLRARHGFRWAYQVSVRLMSSVCRQDIWPYGVFLTKRYDVPYN